MGRIIHAPDVPARLPYRPRKACRLWAPDLCPPLHRTLRLRKKITPLTLAAPKDVHSNPPPPLRALIPPPPTAGSAKPFARPDQFHSPLIAPEEQGY